ncbi:MAG: radical SAM protein [Candidatus Omnitrophica bacterium]|nr:radical SAM protein [Candidatus Omnitrophota bacterium]
MINYLAKMWNKNGLPIHIMFHCTYRCNSKCRSCFLWKEIDESAVENELTVDEIRKIRKHLDDIIWLQIGGGEPFLRKDLPGICDAFGKVNTTAIPTNCLDPEGIEKALKEILKNNRSSLLLSLSLDGLRDTHDAIRGVGGNFDKVTETYQRVSRLREKHPNFKISFNTVIMKENESEITKIIDYVKRSFRADMHSFEFLRGQPRSLSVSLPDIARCRELFPVIKGCISSYGYGGGWKGKILQKTKLYEHDLILETLERNKKKIDCFAGRLSAVINPYGDVYACELINEKIGNLRDFGYDFNKLWTSKKADQIRQKIKSCFCTHSCVYLINSLFNPGVMARTLLR